MTTTSLHDAEVAGRFDALVGRFKHEVRADDYRLAAVGRSLDGLERPTILDLGCGKGRFANHLRRRGSRVIGLDLSARMLAEATGIDRVRGTAHRLPFSDGAFDAVVAIESLEHAADLDGVLNEAARVLRPEGRLVVIDKQAASLDARRPWLPAALVKRIDEHRGRWMYPAGGPVRERWFGVGDLRRRIEARFDRVEVSHLLSPDEASHAVFRAIPRTRTMTCWTAIAPGGGR